MVKTEVEKETLLPIGSVVRFKSWEQLVMIYGRKQMDSKTKEEWDYVAFIIQLVIFQLNIIYF